MMIIMMMIMIMMMMVMMMIMMMCHPPPGRNLTTLGWLKWMQDLGFAYFEWQYLKFIKMNLTDYWEDLQRSTSRATLFKLIHIFEVLELDKKAQVEFILLSQSGTPGRTCANKVLWELLSSWALDPAYEDLSHKVSKEVLLIRKSFDRPPWNHKDLIWWRWSADSVPWNRYLRWHPLNIPPRGPGGRPLPVTTGQGGVPLQPPHCWGGFS